MTDHFVHIPTPGDHYSAATGSAAMTVVYELTRCHAVHAGESTIIVGRGTRHDYPLGTCVEVDFPPFPGRRARVIDTALGRAGLARHLGRRAYRPAISELAPDTQSVIFLHNAPVAVEGASRRCPQAMTCLYAHNELFRTYTRRELRTVLGAAYRVICVSAFLADRISARSRDSDPLRVVNNGVDTERFMPSHHMHAVDEPVILFIGRVIPEKGVHHLLHAARKIRSATRKFRVRIVGSHGFSATDPLSAYEAELRRLAAPIADSVDFVPFIDRHGIVDEYQRAAIFCAPSSWDEPCSLTVPEAMACGLPTVTTRRGGIPEVGRDSVIYVDPEDHHGIADVLASLVDDARERYEWGRRGRARAEEISWQHQYQELAHAIAE